MSDKKVYVVGTVRGREFAGHMTPHDANANFEQYSVVSKAEYLVARKFGIPSYGQYETECKFKGMIPLSKRNLY